MALPLRQGICFLQAGYFQNQISRILVRTYAKKIGKIGGASAQKERMEVETDPEILLKNCCGSNIFIDGKDPELKPDHEYPEWLWSLRTERGGQDLSELDPNSMTYWKRLNKLTSQRNARVSKRLLKLKAIQYPEDSVS